MLLNMSVEIQKFADTVSTVTGLDVEIVTPDLIRVAGTGIYNVDIGKSIKNAGSLLKHTLQHNQSLFIENPKEHLLCQNCQNKEKCKELLAICTPIADNENLYGAVELACFDSKACERMLNNSEIYINFLSYIANTIAERCREKKELIDITELLDAMFQVVNTTGKGTLLFDKDGKTLYYNDKAKEILNSFTLSEITKDCINPAGVSIGELEDFSIELNDESQHVMGKHIILSSNKSKFHSVFVFETMHSLLANSIDISSSACNNSLNQIIGSSSQVHALKEQILAISGTTSTVLITGESGTGKELVARAVHAIGEQKDAPFIAVNCGAIPENLLESELFGYVGGAFTGASPKGKIGKFEMAAGGVLFLDEISCLPIYLQAKLLRALQEKVITRLGANKSIKVNLRIIAASNDNLQELITQNKFRQDLFYRLNVIPIQTTPLRTRMEDLEILISYFINKYCTLFNKPKINLPQSIILRMKNYNWPGNIRELENSIEYLVNMADRNGIINESSLHHTFLNPLKSDSISNKEKHFISLEELEKQTIKEALEYFGDSTESKRKIAEVLGISLATLYRKIGN